jgi:hypothetical protein
MLIYEQRIALMKEYGVIDGSNHYWDASCDHVFIGEVVG